MNLIYKIKTATKDEIYSHLKKCNEYFVPPLSDKVNLLDYSIKLFEKSVSFEAWENQSLVGMINAYFNDRVTHSGYITNVSITKDCMGMGVASTLLNMCIEYAKQHNFIKIKLEVSKNNNTAIHLYNKKGFHVLEKDGNSMLMNYDISSNRH